MKDAFKSIFVWVCSVRIFEKNMGDPYYEPTIMVHNKMKYKPTIVVHNKMKNGNIVLFSVYPSDVMVVCKNSETHPIIMT